VTQNIFPGVKAAVL